MRLSFKNPVLSLCLTVIIILFSLKGYCQINLSLYTKNNQLFAGFRSGKEIVTCLLQNTIDSANLLSLEIKKKGENAFEVTKKFTFNQHRCTSVEQINTTAFGLNWSIEITGDANSWSRPVSTSVQWIDSTGIDFWTTWSDNQILQETELWQDPFLSAPLSNLDLKYGGRDHFDRKAFVIPVATCFFKRKNLAVSFIESPGDLILDMNLQTNSKGTVCYKHYNHRIKQTNKTRFSMQLVLHEPDWRGGMEWFYEHYKEFFTVKEPQADVIAGCASYSSYEGELDTARYKRMGYSVNWKASLDFPYMSMFLPYTKTDDEKWMKMKQNGEVIGDGMASIKQLKDYSQNMLKKGFYTLSYFNVTEAGSHVQKTMPPRNSVMFEDWWKDANDFVYYKMRDAMLVPPDHQFPIVSWDWCTVMDPAEPTFQKHLLDQAKRHIEKIPASSGICIDRLDWLRFYNVFRDDGVSFIDGKEVASMVSSWKDIMKKLGPLMHQSHKVIFSNPLYRRIDVMKEVDGIYDEFGNVWSSLNLCSQMAMQRPMIAWTASVKDFKPNPDAYFQTHLYMGAFLTAPVEGNDHTITPDAAIDQFYLDYGHMLMELKGRKWLLRPNLISIETGKSKANVFEVNSHLIVPIIHGEENEHVKISLALPDKYFTKKKWRVSVLYPGDDKWLFVKQIPAAKSVSLELLLKRGCAMLKVE